MPISKTEYRICPLCGKRYAVRLGDVRGPKDLKQFICGKCRDTNFSKKITGGYHYG